MLLIPIPVSMLIMSHLSDAQELIGMCGKESQLHQQINFAKWLLSRYKDTSVEIDNDTANKEWEAYLERFPMTKMQMGNPDGE